jgi:hypothetical protein
VLTAAKRSSFIAARAWPDAAIPAMVNGSSSSQAALEIDRRSRPSAPWSGIAR